MKKSHSNGFTILQIMLKVEHIKKHNSIDSENRFVKQNADYHNHLTVCFYMFLWYYHAVRKYL